MAVKIKLNRAGFRELRRLPVMQALVMAKAEQVAAAAGAGFKAEHSPGANRARAVVVPDTLDAAVESARNPHHLIGALNAARRV